MAAIRVIAIVVHCVAIIVSFWNQHFIRSPHHGGIYSGVSAFAIKTLGLRRLLFGIRTVLFKILGFWMMVGH